MQKDSEKLSEFFATHLPIAQFMGLKVAHYDDQQLILRAPLEPNINDKQTAFGGSLYTATVMACWGMLFLKTQEAGLSCNQLITKADISYSAPVNGEIRAICKAPDQATFDDFLDSYHSRGKAKLTLQATVESDGKLAVTYQGQYVILRN